MRKALRNRIIFLKDNYKDALLPYMDDCIEQMHNDEFDDDAYFKDLYEQYVNFAEEENINREKLARQLKDCRDEQHQHF